MELQDRLKALRARLELTQDEVAERAEIARTQYVKIENGHTKGRSHPMRVSLAKGFRLPIETMNAYLDGSVSVEEAAALSGKPPSALEGLDTSDAYPERAKAILIREIRGTLNPEVARRLRSLHGKSESERSLEWWEARYDQIAAEVAGERPQVHGHPAPRRPTPPRGKRKA